MKIKWSKATENGITYYTDESGEQITLNAGMTYIALVPSDYWDGVKLK